MKKFLIVFVMFLAFLNCGIVRAAGAEESTEPVEKVTIKVFEYAAQGATKVITIDKGASIELWIPAATELTANCQFEKWVDEEGNTVTSESKFYRDTCIYAVWAKKGEYATVPEQSGGPTDSSVKDSMELEEKQKELENGMKKYIPKIKNLKCSKGKVSISVTFSCDADYYRVMYSKKKDFKSSKSIKIQPDKKEQKLSVKKLKMKKGKTYYIKVQAVKTLGLQTYRSGFSKVKKVKVK